MERPRHAAAGLGVGVGAVKVQDLMQAGFRFVPGLFAGCRQMEADRDGGDLTGRRVVAELAQ